ncbi:MAG: hypothetical protein LBC92_00800 [Rickettsiales bacterium]|jgi:hypothetical protein|nr:hypothetical protein [Rickettsiales bacterium]
MGVSRWEVANRIQLQIKGTGGETTTQIKIKTPTKEFQNVADNTEIYDEPINMGRYSTMGDNDMEQIPDKIEDVLVEMGILKREADGGQLFDFMDANFGEWFELEYNTEIAQIMKNGEITNVVNYINSVKNVINGIIPETQQAILERIDFNKVNEKLDILFNKESLLYDEAEFMQLQEMKAQAAQQQQQIAQMQQEAQLNNLNSQSFKNQAEAKAINNGGIV